VIRLATLYEKNGDAEKARKMCEKAIKTNAKAVPVIVKLAQIYSDRLHDPKRALELAKTAHNLVPDDTEITHTLGKLAY